MRNKAIEVKDFNKVLRGRLTTKPLSLAEISARIRARRKAGQKDKQVVRSKQWRDQKATRVLYGNHGNGAGSIMGIGCVNRMRYM